MNFRQMTLFAISSRSSIAVSKAIIASIHSTVPKTPSSVNVSSSAYGREHVASTVPTLKTSMMSQIAPSSTTTQHWREFVKM